MRLPLRRKLLVSRSQLHLIALNVAYYLAFTLALSLLLLGPLVHGLDDGGSEAERAGTARVLLYMHARLWPLAALMVAASAVHSVFLTHRIVGPLVRFRRVFEAVTTGRLAHRIILRKKDYLTEEARILNRMTDALAERVQRLRACLAALSDGMDELALAERITPGEESRVQALRRRVAELEEELAWFDCGEDEPTARVDVELPDSLLHDSTESERPTVRRP